MQTYPFNSKVTASQTQISNLINACCTKLSAYLCTNIAGVLRIEVANSKIYISTFHISF